VEAGAPAFSACCRLINAALRHRMDSLRRCSFVLMFALRGLLGALVHWMQQHPAGEAAGAALAQCTAALARYAPLAGLPSGTSWPPA
jgi:hypothetical protein